MTWTEATDNDAVAGYRVYRNGSLLADVTDGSRPLCSSTAASTTA